MEIDFLPQIYEYLERFFFSIPKLLFTFILILVAVFVTKFLTRRVERHFRRLAERGEHVDPERRKRIASVAGILRKLAVTIIWIVGLLILLSQVGVNIGPVIAAAGVAGLAISFGAQDLVKDLLRGIFILLENQLRVGDVAIINGTGGLVEEINLRTIVLRALDGTVHVFANGSIETLANMTKGWSAWVFEIGVGYGTDIDNALAVIRRVTEELRNETDYSEKILEPAEIFGLEKFADSALVIKGRIKTKPSQQWTVGREFNRRLKTAFEAAGIEIPFPQQTITFGLSPQPLEVLSRIGTDQDGGERPSETP